MNRRKQSARKMLSLLLALVMAFTPLFPVGVLANEQSPAQPEIVKTGDPAKLVYLEGEVFDLTGFSANVVTTSSAIAIAAEDISADKTGPLTASDTEITITVAPDGLTPAAYNYAITVTAAEPEAPGAGTTIPLFMQGTLMTGTTYAVTTGSAITGGTLTLSAETGDITAVTTGAAVTVKVEPDPDPGKRLVPGSLKYTTDGGSSYTDITNKVNDNEYSFLMPAADVVVTAKFELTPATSVSLAFTAETDTIPAAPTITTKVGDIVTVKATVTANGGVAYGFTGAFSYNTYSLEFLAAEWAKDNPGIAAPAVSNVLRVSIDSDGSTPVFTPESPSKTFIFKFKVTHHNFTGTVAYNAPGSNQRISLFTDPTLHVSDLIKNSDTGEFYQPNDADVAKAIAKTIAVPYNSNIKATINTVTDTSIAFSGVSDLTQKYHVGDTVKVKLTISSSVDAYGFMIPLRFVDTYAELDAGAFAVDNPGIRLDTIYDDYSPWVIKESDGTTKAIKPGDSFEVILTFKIQHELNASFTVSDYNNLVPSCLFTDPNVRAFGESGLISEDWNVGKANVNAAETAGKVSVPTIPSAVSISVALRASATINSMNGLAGVNPRPVTVTMEITPPADKALYGLEVGIVYPGTYLVLDEELTKEANPGLAVGFGGIDGISTASSTTYRVYVESNGSPIGDAGNDFSLNLVFKPTLAGGAATRQISVATGFHNRQLVLFTDPSVRAAATGAGLTTLNFNQDNILAAEAAGKVAKASVTAGSIVLAKPTALQMPLLAGLTLDNAGYYTLTTAEQVQNFADAVNVYGENMIKGSIAAGVTLTDFEGIGTHEHPFIGELKGGPVTINRTVTSGNDQVIGGLVNYLGSGGIVNNLTVNGTINVSGTSGNASIGGVVGKSDGGAISSVTSNVTITATGVSGNVGGIVGTAKKSEVANASYLYALNMCKNTGAVSGGTNTGGIVGMFTGIAGDTTTANTIYRSTNTGAISGVYAGGIVGSSTGGVVTESGNGGYGPYNADPKLSYLISGGGNISGGSAAGGVVGSAIDMAVNNGYNTGAISGGNRLGGIVGYAGGAAAVAESWNGTAAAVAGSANNAAVGGIIGEIGSASVSAMHNFNLGAVTASGIGSAVGGIVGKSAVTPAKYKGNYYLTGTAGGDALGAVSTTSDLLLYAGADSSIPGKYRYISDEPERDSDGTYLLRTAADILWFANAVNTNVAPNELNKINAKLMNDIDLSEEQFAGIGSNTSTATAYSGIFDGGNHTVTLKMTGQYNLGLFGRCLGATLKNLTIAGSITGTSNVAGLVANFQASSINQDGTVIYTGTIENCHNKANVTATNGNAAGIAGTAGAVNIINCTNSGKITTTSGSIGGIVGTYSGPSLIEKCINSGTINGGQQVGGIAGLVRVSTTGDVTIRACSNTGEIKTLYPATSSITNYDSAGGIVGSGDGSNVEYDERAELIIEDCTNSGNVSGTVNRLGGIMGSASGRMYPCDVRILNCVNNGNVTSLYDGGDSNVTRNIHVGGILGKTDGLSAGDWGTDEIITGNKNTGDVSAPGGGKVSSIVAGKEGKIEDNSTTKPVGNDLKDKKITVEKPEDPGTPGGGGSGGESDSGTGDQPGSGMGDQPGSGMSDQPGSGMGDQPGSGTGDQPGSGTGDKPGPNTGGDNYPSKPITGVPAVVTASGTSNITPVTAPIQTAEAIEIADNSAPEQSDDAPANESEAPSADSPNPAQPAPKPATLFEVVQETVRNNPVVVAIVLVATVALVGLGGYRRYRNNHHS